MSEVIKSREDRSYEAQYQVNLNESKRQKGDSLRDVRFYLYEYSIR